MVNKLWKKGEKIHAYWAVSSLVVHLWFILGAAWLNIGLERPTWLVIAIVGFSCSHMARVFAYDYHDTIASSLEFLGVMCLLVCCGLEAVNYTVFGLIWLCSSTFERITHLPSALRRDANWMRSYDLWEAAVKKSNEFEPSELKEVVSSPSSPVDDLWPHVRS